MTTHILCIRGISEMMFRTGPMYWLNLQLIPYPGTCCSFSETEEADLHISPTLRTNRIIIYDVKNIEILHIFILKCSFSIL